MKLHRAYDGGDWIIGTSFIFDIGTETWYFINENGEHTMVSKPESQIGWTDKNGKEAYLHDIISDGTRNGVIRFDNGEFYVDWRKGEFYQSSISKLPNRYEIIDNLTEEKL